MKHAFEMSTPYIFGLAGAIFVQSEKELKWLLNAIVFALIPSFACVLLWQIGAIQGGEILRRSSVGSETAFDEPATDRSFGDRLPPAHPGSYRSFFGVPAFSYRRSKGVVESRFASWSCRCSILAIRGWMEIAVRVLIVCMALVVFYLPAMQERLFPETGSGTLFDLFRSKQSGMGRFEAWPLIYEKALEAPVLGHA